MENKKNPLFQYKERTGKSWSEISWETKLNMNTLQQIARATRETVKEVRLKTAWQLLETINVDLFNTKY